jgi:hypothetical protein
VDALAQALRAGHERNRAPLAPDHALHDALWLERTHHLFASARCVIFNCTMAMMATITKISVLMAAARPKFWPLSVKAMR